MNSHSIKLWSFIPSALYETSANLLPPMLPFSAFEVAWHGTFHLVRLFDEEVLHLTQPSLFLADVDQTSIIIFIKKMEFFIAFYHMESSYHFYSVFMNILHRFH